MTDSEIIDALGGTFKVAEMCEVKPPSVSDWRTAGIPNARRMYLRAIRPDLSWPELVTTTPAATKPDRRKVDLEAAGVDGFHLQSRRAADRAVTTKQPGKASKT